MSMKNGNEAATVAELRAENAELRDAFALMQSIAVGVLNKAGGSLLLDRTEIEDLPADLVIWHEPQSETLSLVYLATEPRKPE